MTRMSELESKLSSQLHRRADALPIDDGVPDRIVRRIRVRQRRRRAALVSAPAVIIAVVALATALVAPSGGHPGRPRVSAVPATHGPQSAAAARSPSRFAPSPGFDSPALAPVGTNDLRWVDFVSPTRGWALAEVDGQLRVAHTSDAGHAWAVVGSPLPTSPSGPMPTRLVVALGGNGIGANVAGLYAFTGANVLGSDTASRLYLSRDGAASWHVVEFPGPVLGIAPPPGAGSSTLGPPASEGELWALIGSSTNGGRASPAQLEVSVDAGRTWRRSAPIRGGGEGVGSLTRVGQRRGLVVLQNTASRRPTSLLLETTDGGTSWQQLADPCSDLPDQQLSAPSASELWLACGSEPVGNLQAKSVYVSANAARTWRRAASVGLTQPASAGSLSRLGYIAGLAATSSHDLWLALGRGPAEMTTDAGRTWRPAFSLPAGTGGSDEVTFVDATHGWVLTSRGLWHTADGVRWESIGG